MRDNFLNDVEKMLLHNKFLSGEDAFAVFNALIEKYQKLEASSLGKRYEKNESEEIKNVIKSLPKYDIYFDVAPFEECLETYKSTMPTQVKLYEKDMKRSISSLSKKVIAFQADTNKFSRNSGVNIINDRTNYTNSIMDFESASDPELIKGLIKKVGKQSPELVKACEERCKSLCKDLAETAIDDRISYYNRLVDYLVDFYADTEIARRQEESERLSRQEELQMA